MFDNHRISNFSGHNQTSRDDEELKEKERERLILVI